MTSNAEHALALRQQALIARSTALRRQLGEQSAVLRGPLAAADAVRDAGRWLYEQRALIAGGVVVLLVVRPRRAWRVGRAALWIWRAVRWARPWLAAAGLAAAARR